MNGPIIAGIDSTHDFGTSLINEPIPWVFGIKNRGDQILEINKIQLNNGKKFQLTTTPRVIPPNSPDDSLLATVTFKSNEIGYYEDTLSIESNSVDGTKQISLKAKCMRGSVIALSKNELDFGKIRINEKGSDEFYIQNRGTDSLFISEFTLRHKELIRIIKTSNHIAPSESLNVTLIYNPKNSSTSVDTLSITSNAINGMQLLILRGEGVAPIIHFSETEYDFGDAPILKMNGWQLDVKNSGDDTLNFCCSFEKSDHIFDVKPSNGRLEPYSSVAFKIGFQPQNDTLYQNRLRIFSEKHRFFYGDSVLSISGNGYVAPILTPDSIHFGDVLVHTTREHSFSIENHARDTLYFSTDIINNSTAVFWNSNSTTFIPPHQKNLVVVHFRPNDIESYEADLIIKSKSLQSGEIRTHLSGKGVDDAIMSLSHAKYDFGQIRIGTSKAIHIQIKNTGNRKLALFGSQWEPHSDSTAFQIAIDDTSLEENDSTAILISFTPHQMKQFRGILHLRSTTEWGDCSIQLSGEGSAPVMAFSDTVNAFGEVGVNETYGWPCIIQNTGTAALYISRIEVLQHPDIFLIDKQQAQVATGDSLRLTIAFHPRNIETYRDSVRIISDAFNQPIAYIILSGQGVDLEGPVIIHAPIEIATQDESIPFSANIIDSFSGVQEGMLYYRISGTPEYLIESLQHEPEANNPHFFYTISGDMVTSHGIDYYLIAFDSIGNMARIPKQGYNSIRVRVTEQGASKIDSVGFPVPQPAGSAQTAYRMISMPFELINPHPNNVLTDDLGGYDPSKWILADYRFPGRPYPDCFVYVDHDSISNFIPGKAFFLLVREQGKVIDSGPGTSVRTDQPFNINLEPGWNMIGNPFNFPIPLENISFKSRQSLNLLTYDGQWNGFFTNPVAAIQPWEGYAIYNSTTTIDTLIINPDLTSDFSRVNQTGLSKFPNESIWKLQIVAKCHEALDGLNYVGLSKSASFKFDRMDYPEPPAVGEFIMLTFPHNDWGDKSAFYTTDFQPINEKGNIWEFQVITSLPNSPIKLEFHETGAIAENDDLILIDRDLRIARNLRIQQEYSFFCGLPFEGRAFRLILGSDSLIAANSRGIKLVPETFELFQNFPNPFNSVTSIKYALPKNSSVHLAIYNLSGELVKTLIDQPSHAQGYYLAIWDGLDSDENSVASGIYFARLKTFDFKATKKLVLIK